MSKINDGGPAFPRASLGEDNGDRYGTQDGMSLRDWFAGQALAGQMANPHTEEADLVELARVAYRAADVMLYARRKDNA